MYSNVGFLFLSRNRKILCNVNATSNEVKTFKIENHYTSLLD